MPLLETEEEAERRQKGLGLKTIFMNPKNSKTNESNRSRLYFTDKLDLRGNKTIALVNLSIYYTWQNVKSEYKNNKFKI